MEIRKPKTLEDLPKFVVTAVRRGPTAENGYTHFEVDGRLDYTIESTGPQWFWLLFGKRGCLRAGVQSLMLVSPPQRISHRVGEGFVQPSSMPEEIVGMGIQLCPQPLC